MADLEALRLISNIGAFGLMAIFVCWVLFRASPQLLASVEAMNAKNAEANVAMTADHKTTMLAMAATFQTTVATLTREFREALATQAAECRSERGELLRRTDDLAEKDRATRHEIADKYATAINRLAVAQMKLTGEPLAPPPPRAGG